MVSRARFSFSYTIRNVVRYNIGMYMSMKTYGAIMPSMKLKGSLIMGGIFIGTVIAVICAFGFFVTCRRTVLAAQFWR